jgi:hypothetical protein
MNIVYPIRAAGPAIRSPVEDGAELARVLALLAGLEREQRQERAAIEGAPCCAAEKAHRLRQIDEAYRAARRPLVQRLGTLHQGAMNAALFGMPAGSMPA